MSEPNSDQPAAPQAVPPTPAGYQPPAQSSSPSQLPPPPGYEAPEPAGPPQFPAPPPPPKKKRTGLIVGIIVAVVVLLVGCGIGGVLLLRTALAGQVESAEVNDCLSGTTLEELDVNKLAIVDCGDPSAVFQVVQKVPGLTQAEADADPKCTAPGAVTAVWFGREGSTGNVLCLKTV